MLCCVVLCRVVPCCVAACGLVSVLFPFCLFWKFGETPAEYWQRAPGGHKTSDSITVGRGVGRGLCNASCVVLCCAVRCNVALPCGVVWFRFPIPRSSF